MMVPFIVLVNANRVTHLWRYLLGVSVREPEVEAVDLIGAVCTGDEGIAPFT